MMKTETLKLLVENGVIISVADWTRELVINYLERGYRLWALPRNTIERFKNDDELVKIAVSNNPYNFVGSSESKELYMLALRTAQKMDTAMGNYSWFSIMWRHKPRYLKNDPDILVEELLHGKMEFTQLPQELQNDKTVVIKYLTKNPQAILPKGLAFKDDPDIIHMFFAFDNMTNFRNYTTPMLLFDPKFINKLLRYDMPILDTIYFKPLLVQNYDYEIEAQVDIKLWFRFGF